ncbi:hypothetical protein RB200_35440 [Streptomyces sp. PmtG]
MCTGRPFNCALSREQAATTATVSSRSASGDAAFALAHPFRYAATGAY